MLTVSFIAPHVCIVTDYNIEKELKLIQSGDQNGYIPMVHMQPHHVKQGKRGVSDDKG
jgi:hypothetical protein